jgi:hypothetical protein
MNGSEEWSLKNGEAEAGVTSESEQFTTRWSVQSSGVQTSVQRGRHDLNNEIKPRTKNAQEKAEM